LFVAIYKIGKGPVTADANDIILLAIFRQAHRRRRSSILGHLLDQKLRRAGRLLVHQSNAVAAVVNWQLLDRLILVELHLLT